MDLPQNPFYLVSQNLRSIGALTLDAFFNNLPNDCFSDLRKPTGASQGTRPEGSHLQGISPVTRLAQVCSRAFSQPNLINYELLEKSDSSGVYWKCILTIRRPDGQVRSYQTEFVHPRKQDARVGAATIALRLGAIEFITSFGRSSGFRHESRDALADVNNDAKNINYVEKIESLCKQWHNEQVSPQWIQFMVVDQQNRGLGATKYGAALRVQVSPHLLEAYSTDTTFLSYSEAKSTCAREAVENGVLDFIRSVSSGSSAESRLAIATPVPPSPDDHTTLHTFFDALPKPFPNFPDPHAKTVAELSRAPVAYVNNALQSCRGGRFRAQYIWNSDFTHNLHGCLLRVCRAERTKSYLVDAIFHKRNDAKSAVCLLAFSQGLGSYIHSVAEEVERQITPAMRKVVTERVLPTISSMCFKASKLLDEPIQAYEFRVDNDAAGCTLKLPILATHEVEAEERKLQFKTYVVDSVYANKVDAKIAAAWLAYNDGAVTLDAQLSHSSASPISKGSKRKRKADDAELEPGELDPEPSGSSSKVSSRRKRRKFPPTVSRRMEGEDEDDGRTAQSKKAPSAAGPSRPKPSTSKPRFAKDAGRLDEDGHARIRSIDAGLSRLMTAPMYPAGYMYPPPVAPYRNFGVTPNFRPTSFGDAVSPPTMWYPNSQMPNMGHYQQQRTNVPQPTSHPRRTYSDPSLAGTSAHSASRPPVIDREMEEGETMD